MALTSKSVLKLAHLAAPWAMVFALAACGGGGGGDGGASGGAPPPPSGSGGTPPAPPPPAAPSPPVASTLSVQPSLKRLTFAWTPAAGATFYRLFEANDGVTYRQLDADLSATLTQLPVDIGVHNVNWSNARYRLDACNSAGCTSSNTLGVAREMLATIGYFKPSNTYDGFEFGTVALSRDGNTLAVGAMGESGAGRGVGAIGPPTAAIYTGAVYVFARSSGGVWSQEAFIKASNADARDMFGASLALSDDGNMLVVGAPGEASNGGGPISTPATAEADNSAPGAGAAYVYTRSGNQWTKAAYLKAPNPRGGNLFGSSVAIGGGGRFPIVAVGSPSEPSNARFPAPDGGSPDTSAASSGAVYTYTLQYIPNGATEIVLWTAKQYLKSPNSDAGDAFGSSVALTRSGSTLVVGAPGEASAARGIGGNQADNTQGASGAVYVFSSAAEPAVYRTPVYVKASNTRAGDRFGDAVAVSESNGIATLIVGAPNNDGTSSVPIQQPGPASASVGDAQMGAVYVFVGDTGLWSQQAYVTAPVKASPSSFFNFGSAVAVSDDGNTFAAGAPGDSLAFQGVFAGQVPGPTDPRLPYSGGVSVYGRSNGNWALRNYLKATNPDGKVSPFSGDQFASARAIALSGDAGTLAIGATYEGSAATGIGGDQADNSFQSSDTGAGAVYLF